MKVNVDIVSGLCDDRDKMKNKNNKVGGENKMKSVRISHKDKRRMVDQALARYRNNARSIEKHIGPDAVHAEFKDMTAKNIIIDIMENYLGDDKCDRLNRTMRWGKVRDELTQWAVSQHKMDCEILGVDERMPHRKVKA